MANIPTDQYIPLGAGTAFEFIGFNSIKGVEYTLIAHGDIPRTEIGAAISKRSWELPMGRPWKDVDLKKEKIVILGHDQNTQSWKEITPTKITGNEVTFTLPENHTMDRFLPAMVIKPK